jgi:hypothetical protein
LLTHASALSSAPFVRSYFKILRGVNECGIESDIVTVEV